VTQTPVQALQMLRETFADLLRDQFPAESVVAAESTDLPIGGWRPLAAGGFPWISIDEDRGGSGGTLAEALALVPLLGRYAVPLPFIETGLLASWLLAGAGLPIEVEGHQTISDAGQDLALERVDGDRIRISGTLPGVPWGASATSIVAVKETGGRSLVLRLPREGLEVIGRRSLAGEPRDDAVLDGLVLASGQYAESHLPDAGRELRLRGALCRGLQIAGALERIAELTVDYAHVREQFGRPIIRFQAIAHHLAQLTEEVAVARTATGVAAEMYAAGSTGTAETIAMAKIIASRSAGTAARLAHQVHGAIGTTREYQLHLFTRRVWSWMDEFGSGAWWSADLGALITGQDPARHWDIVTLGLRRP
jgi:acyl-CoA dehydrogenase